MSLIPVGLSSRRNDRYLRREKGAVAVIVALSLVALVGFVGLALDLGKLFVAKTELQNSADACALAAARELAGANTNQLILAEAAGLATGERHNVLFQDEQVVISSVAFSETLTGSYQAAFTGPGATNMRFARCEANRADIANWLIQVLNILPDAAIGNQTVAASAVATLTHGQSTCALPVAVCESSLATKEKGDWLESLLDPGEGLTGDFLWASFAGKGTKDIKNLLTGPGECNIPVTGEKIGDPGVRAGAYDAWNTRFGAYKGTYSVNNAPPDWSGYAYTAKNWPSCKDAASDFFQKRADYTPIQEPSIVPTGLKVLPPARAAIRDEYISKGGDRRPTIVPSVDCPEFETNKQATIERWVCVLMLHPLDQNPDADAFAGCSSGPGNRAFLEYLGSADDPDSPCASSGIVGGPASVGPMVPALVR